MYTHKYTQHSGSQPRLLRILHTSPGEWGLMRVSHTPSEYKNPFLNIVIPKSPVMWGAAGISLSCPSPLQGSVASTHLSSPLPSWDLSTLCPHRSHISSFSCLATTFCYLKIPLGSPPPPLEIYQRISSTQVQCISKNNSSEWHFLCLCTETNLENNIKLENLLHMLFAFSGHGLDPIHTLDLPWCGGHHVRTTATQ